MAREETRCALFIHALFPASSKLSVTWYHPTDRIAHNTAYATPAVEHWLQEKYIDGYIRRDSPVGDLEPIG